MAHKKTMPGRVYAPGQEDEFKRDFIKAAARVVPEFECFQIENEEKEPGFPDAIVLSGKGTYTLYEFKMSDKKGNIKFEKTQLLFYKRHPNLRIFVAAWDVPCQAIRFIGAEKIVAARKLTYRLPVEE
jgi:hypothetical protein